MAEARAPVLRLTEQVVEREWLAAKLLNLPVLSGQHVREPVAEPVRVEQVAEPEPPARGLVGVGGADAALGRADHVLARPAGLLQAVDQRVIGHHDVRPFAEEQVRGGHARRLDLLQLREQVVRVHHAAGADDALRDGVEHPRRHHVQRKASVLVHHGVTGVVAALVPDGHVRVLGEVVDDPTLALVAVLRTDHCGDWHVASYGLTTKMIHLRGSWC